MISLSDFQINALIGGFFWPFVRVMALLSVDPLFATRSLPNRVRVGFALLLTVLIVPILPPFPVVPLLSAHGFNVLLQQVLIGLAMGFVMRLVMTAIEIAGLIMSNQMGLGFAMVFDPIHSAQVPTLSRLLSLFTFLLFITFDGHHVVLSTLVESFSRMPVGQSVPHLTWRHLVEWGGNLFAWGVWLSLPIIAALTVSNIAIGVMSRASSQLNIFSFGFSLTIGVGFVMFYLTLPLMVPVIEKIYRASFEFMLAMFTFSVK